VIRSPTDVEYAIHSTSSSVPINHSSPSLRRVSWSTTSPGYGKVWPQPGNARVCLTSRTAPTSGSVQSRPRLPLSDGVAAGQRCAPPALPGWGCDCLNDHLVGRVGLTRSPGISGQMTAPLTGRFPPRAWPLDTEVRSPASQVQRRSEERSPEPLSRRTCSDLPMPTKDGCSSAGRAIAVLAERPPQASCHLRAQDRLPLSTPQPRRQLLSRPSVELRQSGVADQISPQRS